MLDFLHNTIADLPGAATVIISVSLMIFAGFAMTRLTKKVRLPNVTAYIIAGMLLGPYCLDLVPQTMIDGMDFISDIATALIAFGMGEFFRVSTLKKSGAKVIVITLFETIVVAVLIFVVTFFALKLDFAFAIVLSALSAATASASTMMTIRQTKAKGDYVDTLLQVIAIDNVISLLAYSVAISLALASIMAGSGGAKPGAAVIWLPILKNIAALAIGALFGLILKLLIPTKRSTDNRLIIAVGVLFTFCGICTAIGVSPLLGCMMIGTVYINLTDDSKLFLQLNYFSPPILLIFFVRSGLSFRLDSLTEVGSVGGSALWVVAIVYFFVRILGKYAGAFAGCAVVRKSPKVRNYLGLALIPQAGVAIGLAAIGARTLGGELGDALNTIILTSSILYELVGPVLAKLSLSLSGAYSDKLEEITEVEPTAPDGTPRTELELLIERIHAIQSELPSHDRDPEQAFTEAAEEQLEAMMAPRRGLMRR